jgi:hypothetical protein
MMHVRCRWEMYSRIMSDDGTGSMATSCTRGAGGDTEVNAEVSVVQMESLRGMMKRKCFFNPTQGG